MSNSVFEDGGGAPEAPKQAKKSAVKRVAPKGSVPATGKPKAAKPAATTALAMAAGLPERAPFSGVEPTPKPAVENNLPAPVSVLPDGRVRVPFGQQAKKLDYSQREGFQRRWINDYPGRIQRAQRGGWVHVEELGKPVESNVGSQGLKAFLMEIPNEFYEADFEAKQEKLNEVDAQIYHGTHKQEAGDRRYVPEGAIKVGVQRGR